MDSEFSECFDFLEIGAESFLMMLSRFFHTSP